MRVDHTATSRATVTAASLLVLVQLVRLVTGDHASYIAALLLTLVVATAGAGVKMSRDNCLESRVAVALLATLSGGGGILIATAGLPGRTPHPVTALDLLTVLLSCGVLALLTIDQPRRAASQRSESPYAS